MLRATSSHKRGDPTIHSIEMPELDIVAVSDAYQRRVREFGPSLVPMATRLLERLPPERWMLEWYLPWWLGRALDLDEALCRQIVLSNVLGLGFVRLTDDLADGDVATDDVAATTMLTTALYRAALEPYRALFSDTSPFWSHLERSMATWREAVDEPGDLAGRGAPLRISAFAVCLMAGRQDLYPAVDRMLDQALEALVLHDHLADWQADLGSGRWNAFVASVSDGPQVEHEQARHRRTVLVAMMTGEALTTQVERIRSGLMAAATLADSIEVPLGPLGTHLRAFARQIGMEGLALQAHYRAMGDQAARLLLDPLVDG